MKFFKFLTSRRKLLKWGAAAPLGLLGARLGEAGTAAEPSPPLALPHVRIQHPDIANLFREATVVDAACPLIHPGMGEQAFENYVDEMLKGGVNLALATAASVETFEQTIETIHSYYPLFEKLGDRVHHARSLDDVRRAKEQGKVAIVFHFQGSGMLDFELGRLRLFKELGVRVIQLAYNWKFLVGDGCTERTDCGLTDFGVEVVKEMNRLGIVVDCSHTGYRTTMEAIELSEDPVLFTHSNAWAVSPSKRNIKDDQIRAVTQKGGVIGVNAFPAFLTRGDDASLAKLLEHVDYLVNLVGSNHVGLGLDFTTRGDMESYRYWRYDPETYPHPPWIYPSDIDTPAKIPDIARGLRARGYDDEQLLGILRGNFMRVFERVWSE